MNTHAQCCVIDLSIKKLLMPFSREVWTFRGPDASHLWHVRLSKCLLSCLQQRYVWWVECLRLCQECKPGVWTSYDLCGRPKSNGSRVPPWSLAPKARIIPLNSKSLRIYVNHQTETWSPHVTVGQSMWRILSQSTCLVLGFCCRML